MFAFIDNLSELNIFKQLNFLSLYIWYMGIFKKVL